jgi:hypothetical protein
MSEGHNIEPVTRRCRNLGHRWVAIDAMWVCVRYGCEAWYDPRPSPTISHEYLDEAWGRWIPTDPPPEPWGS